MAGIRSRPAARVARQRRSPMISSYCGCPSTAPAGRTTIGCSTPISRIEYTNSAIDVFVEDLARLARIGNDRGHGDLGEAGAGDRHQIRRLGWCGGGQCRLGAAPVAGAVPGPVSATGRSGSRASVGRGRRRVGGLSVDRADGLGRLGGPVGEEHIDGPIARRLGGGRPARDEGPEPAPQTASLLAHACSSRTSSGLRTSAASTCSASSRAASR